MTATTSACKLSESGATNTAGTPGRDSELKGTLAMSDAVLSMWKTLAEDWLALSREQLETNFQLVRSLAECRDPVAAAALHLDSAHTTVSRCISAAVKASNTVDRLTSAALTDGAILSTLASRRAA